MYRYNAQQRLKEKKAKTVLSFRLVKLSFDNFDRTFKMEQLANRQFASVHSINVLDGGFEILIEPNEKDDLTINIFIDGGSLAPRIRLRLAVGRPDNPDLTMEAMFFTCRCSAIKLQLILKSNTCSRHSSKSSPQNSK